VWRGGLGLVVEGVVVERWEEVVGVGAGVEVRVVEEDGVEQEWEEEGEELEERRLERRTRRVWLSLFLLILLASRWKVLLAWV